MLFTTLTFILIFLPLTLAIYFLAKDKYKNYILLAVSLLFYSWGEPTYIVLMLLSIMINYILARLIAGRGKKHRKLLLILAIIINIGLLFYFKYLNFLLGNLNEAFGFSLGAPDVVLPIGISFYTFQILSYVIDVYRGEVKVQKNIFTLGTYISLFPQLIAGPIVRYADIEEQLAHRTHSVEKFCEGMRRFIVGFAKKILIANNVAIIADQIFNHWGLEYFGPWVIILGTLAYTLQIYYDFSGYSDMAIGLGKMFGFDFAENFNYPYAATSITDFWRRWHISLSTWFRDYVYIPLGGNRCSKPKWIRNFLIVWILTGLWHGASWNFLLWGLYYAAILLFEKLFFHKVLEKLPGFFRWVYAFLLANIGWIFFRVENLAQLKAVFHNLLTFHGGIGMTDFLLNNFYVVPYAIFIIIGLIFIFPLGRWIKESQRLSARLHLSSFRWQVVRDVCLILLLVISIGALVDSSYNPFIYFRF